MKKMLKNMLVGAAVFAVVGIAIGFIFPPLAPVFAAIGVQTGLVSSVAAGTYAPWILEGAMFGLFGLLVPPVQAVANKLFGDDNAKAAAFQLRENQALEMKCMELDGREHQLEASMGRSRAVREILHQGPRSMQSFASAEEARQADIAAPTIH